MDLHTLLIVAAIVLFLLDGFHVGIGLNCTALGFACLAATLLTGTALTVVGVAAVVLLVVWLLNARPWQAPAPK